MHKKINSNQQYICPSISYIVNNSVIDLPVSFTPRELEMLQYFAQGLSLIQTAEKTNLSKHTVVAHRRNMMSKTNTKSITELLAFARRLKIID